MTTYVDLLNDFSNLDQLITPSVDGSPNGVDDILINDLMKDMSVAPLTGFNNFERGDTSDFEKYFQFDSHELHVPNLGLDPVAAKGPLAQVLSSNATLTYSPNPTPRKKRQTNTRSMNGRQSVDEEAEEEIASGSTLQTPGGSYGKGRPVTPKNTQQQMDAALNQMLLGAPADSDLSNSLLSDATSMDRVNYMSSNGFANSPYLSQSPPAANAIYYQQQQAAAQQAQRRKANLRQNSFPQTTIPPYIKTNGNPVEQTPAIPALDANFAKVQLMEMGYPHLKKDPKAFCTQVVNFLSTYCKILVGGFYINNNQSMNPASAWILSCTYPSLNDFNQYFHYHVGERFIMQAAVEKRCFCVHSSSWENNSNLLSFLFVPIPNEHSQGNAIGVMVLGTVIVREEELHTHLLFLDQVRKSIATTLRTLLQIQHNLYILQKMDYSGSESESAKQANVAFERYVVTTIANMKGDEANSIVIGTNVKGLITYLSPAAQQALGYVPEELVGRVNLTQLHDMSELCLRSREVEIETGKALPADFTVISYKTVFTRGTEETKLWTWTKKDKSTIQVRLTIRPLSDETGILGFILIGRDDLADSAQSPQLDIKPNN